MEFQMNNDTTEADKYDACSKFLDEGKFVEAVKMAESLSYAPFRAAIFIDGGFALRDSSKVRKRDKNI